MRKYIIFFIVLINSSLIFSESFSQNDIIKIINTFKTKDKNQIAVLMKFPIRRNYPLDDILDRDQFINEFDTLFDEDTIERIGNSDPKKDWWEGGWRGLSVFDGLIWVDYDLKIIAINNETEIGTRKKQALIENDRLSLPVELRNYDYPLLKWRTINHIIRVDVYGNKYRLIVYDSNNKIIKVLNNGQFNYDGNSGNYIIDFLDEEIVHRIFNNIFDESTYSTFNVNSSEIDQINNPITEEVRIKEVPNNCFDLTLPLA